MVYEDDYPEEHQDNSESAHHSQQPYDILPLEKIFHELNGILEEVQALIYLDKGWCLLLLKEFKWDKDYLREEYYNKMELYQKRVGLRPGLTPCNDCKQAVDVC